MPKKPKNEFFFLDNVLEKFYCKKFQFAIKTLNIINFLVFSEVSKDCEILKALKLARCLDLFR